MYIDNFILSLQIAISNFNQLKQYLIQIGYAMTGSNIGTSCIDIVQSANSERLQGIQQPDTKVRLWLTTYILCCWYFKTRKQILITQKQTINILFVLLVDRNVQIIQCYTFIKIISESYQLLGTCIILYNFLRIKLNKYCHLGINIIMHIKTSITSKICLRTK